MSTLNGEAKPYFQPISVERIGMLSVESVYMPGGKTSVIWPLLTKTAFCDSRTVSFAPILISLA